MKIKVYQFYNLFQKQYNQKIDTNSFNYYELLGKGAFGRVYLVQRRDNKEYYAMKVMEKEKMMKSNLIRYAQAENDALRIMNHPFIVKLNHAFQSETQLFLVMDYCNYQSPGGDLSKLLDKKGRLTEQVAKIYVAEIILALEALHKNCIIFRDLKPENVVLDENGHAMLTDFGLSKTGVEAGMLSFDFCGTPAYMAPEILKKKGHSRQVDWYLMGVLTYELLVGIPPYFADDKVKLYQNIVNGILKIPKFLSEKSISFIVSLLDRNPQTRLGSKNDASDLKQHPWLEDIDWNECEQKKLKPPKPDLRPIPEKMYDNLPEFKIDDQNFEKMQGWSFQNNVSEINQSLIK